MTRSIRSFSSSFYPLMNPPSRQGYRLEIYDQLLANEKTMVYEIRKPFEPIPFTIVIQPYEDHLAFFHTLWNLDEFDESAADRHFMMRVWHHLCPHRGPWRPALYDLCIDEEAEPVIYRLSAPLYLMERLYVNEEDKGIKQCIGRFCMNLSTCVVLAFLCTLIHVLLIFLYSTPIIHLLTKKN